MIRRNPKSGRYYCDGHECGYPLSWVECHPEEGASGIWVCLDCGAGMYASRKAWREDTLAAMGEPEDSLMLGGNGGVSDAEDPNFY